MGSRGSHNMSKILVISLLLATAVYTLESQGEWQEEEWAEDARQVGWGSAPKTKTIRLDVDAAVAGSTAGVCVEAKVPTWVPTASMNAGMNAIWNTKLGKKISAALSKSVDVSSDEFKAEEKACDKDANTKTLLNYNKELPFVGTIGFSVYSAMSIAGFSMLELTEDEVNELVEEQWGNWGNLFKPKPPKTISMDMDANMGSGLASGSICFQATIPALIPTSTLGQGMKKLLDSAILKKLTEANPGMQIAPDEDTALVAETPCDKKENPDKLLDMSLPSIPFIGKLSIKVYGSGIKTDLSKLYGGGR